MFDFRDMVEYILIVFQKKKLEPIDEEEAVEIKSLMSQAMEGEPILLKQVTGKSGHSWPKVCSVGGNRREHP